MPNNETFATSTLQDPGEISAVNSESLRLERKIKEQSLQGRTRSVSSNPRDKGVTSRESTTRTLRQEYASAMEKQGMEGRILALATLRVAQDNAVPLDEIVDLHRSDKHRRYLREGAQLERARGSIPSGQDFFVNPYSNRGGPSSIGTYGFRNRAVVPTGSSPKDLLKKGRRKPLWK
jgi:hypothetical protein